jgi:hypothetical protein
MAKKNTKPDDNFLLYIPEKKHKEYELRDGLVYLIFYHNKPLEKFMHWLVKKPAVSDVKLDKIGTFVWQAIDGRSSVYEIGQKMKEEFGKSCEPVYDRLIMYLRYLIRMGWVAMGKTDQPNTNNN